MPGLCCPAFLCPYATALSPPTIFGNVCYKVMTQQSSQPQKPQTGESDARRFYTDAGKVLRVVVPVCVTVIMVGWLFTKIDFGQLREILSHDVHIEFIILMMAITALSHMIRGIRWGIQLRAAGVPRMTVTAESVSIFGAYALNLLLPYLGEAWRCVFVSRRERVKLSTVVGTDLGDRLSDAVVVTALAVLAFVVAQPVLMRFFERYPVGEHILSMVSHPATWITVAAVLAVLGVGLYCFCRTQFVHGMMLSGKRIWTGFAVLFTMKGRWEYLLLTLGIWTCYFMETYSCFWAFDFTRELIHQPGMAAGFLPGLIVFVFGSFSMAVPSNGGLGPWNVAVMWALMLYGVHQTDAVAYSIVAWGFQAMTLVGLGIFSACYIMRGRHSSPRMKADS